MLSATEVNEDGEIEDDCEESHSLVEEFMLLANCSVAERTLETFREFSLLRRHPIPPPANFEPLLQVYIHLYLCKITNETNNNYY